MTVVVRASGAAGIALLALVSSPAFAVDADTGPTTSAATASISEIAAPSVTSQPVLLASAAAPTVAGFSAFLRAAQPSTPQPAAAASAAAPAPTSAADTTPIPVVEATAPTAVTLLAPVRPELPSASAKTGFSAFFPKIFPASAKAVEAVVSLPGKLGGIIQNYLSSSTRDAEHECLATAVYYESKGEPLEGQLAVAKVVLNRVKSGQYASSVCGVVKQKAQFSFVRRGQLPSAPKQSAAWQRAVAVAAVARDNLADSVAKNAMSFHATYVAPAWRRGMSRVARIGAHIFYR